MTKNEFIREIKIKTKNLTKAERKEIISYYNEMISERIEDGMSECDAIEAIGSVDELMSSYAPAKPVAEPRSPRLRAWHIVLIVIGSPLWICLLAAMLCVLLAFYIVIWAVVIAFYAVFAALAAAAAACFFAGFVVSIFTGSPALFFAYIGISCVLSGLGILWLMLSNIVAKGIAKLTGRSAKGMFRFFFKRRKG